MSDEEPMEPPTKRWKIDETTKSALAWELVKNTIFLRDKNPTADMENLLDQTTMEKTETLQQIQEVYEEQLTEPVYETNHILDLVYYPFTKKPPSIRVKDEKEYVGYDPKSFFILTFRQHFRILRRLVYFTYIQQGMLEECTRFDSKKLKIYHKYYGEDMIVEIQDRIARDMQLEEYVRYHMNEKFKIQQVIDKNKDDEESIELASVGIDLLPKTEKMDSVAAEIEKETFDDTPA